MENSFCVVGFCRCTMIQSVTVSPYDTQRVSSDVLSSPHRESIAPIIAS